jgi:hypothetical protein
MLLEGEVGGPGADCIARWGKTGRSAERQSPTGREQGRHQNRATTKWLPGTQR